jgi:hypothetical protein
MAQSGHLRRRGLFRERPVDGVEAACSFQYPQSVEVGWGLDPQTVDQHTVLPLRPHTLEGRDQPASVVDLLAARCEDAMDNINMHGRDRTLAAIPKLSRAVRLALATASVRVGIWRVNWLYTQRATLQQEA